MLINVGRSFNLSPMQSFTKILLPAALPTIFVGIRLGLIFTLINVVGVEFLINFGGLGQLINDLAERYDLPGTYAAIFFVILVSVVFFHRHRKGRAMAETGALKRTHRRRASGPIRCRGCASQSSWRVLVVWEAVAASGLLYRDVVPSLLAIGRALVKLLINPEFYWHLGVTLGEVGTGLVIGGVLGLIVGLVLGANRLLAQAYESFLYYLGPTPKIIFFPIMIMWFGVGPGSKVAMGAVSCFFPVALSAAAGIAPDRHRC